MMSAGRLNDIFCKSLVISFLAAIISLPTLSLAAIITICSSGCNSTTVQGGINTASVNDEVRITDSMAYNETVVLNKSVNLTSNVTLYPTIYQDVSTVSGATVINITSNSVNMSKINVKYNGTGANTYGITVFASNYVTLDTVNVSCNQNAFTNFAINLAYANYTIIRNSSMITGDVLIEIGTSSNSTIVGNKLGGGGTYWGIRMLNLAGSNSNVNNTFANNTFTSLSYSFTDSSASPNITFINNTITGTPSYDMVKSAGNGGVYTNNIIQGNPWDGFDISGNNNTISNNIIAKVSQWGIKISGGSNVVTNNTINATAWVGIWACSLTKSNITSNTVNSSSLGIIVGFYNSSLSCTSSPESNNTIIKENIINNTQQWDIYVSNSSAAGNPVVFSINNTLNKSKINVTTNGTLYNQYYLDVLVQDDSNNLINLAVVNGTDSGTYASLNPTTTFNTTTNTSGYITQQIITEFMANASNTTPSSFFYFTNYTLIANKSGFTNASLQVNLTSSMIITLTLKGFYNATVNFDMSSFTVFWNDTIRINGSARYGNLTGVYNAPVNITVGSAKCDNTTDGTGNFTCVFGAPQELGIYTVLVNVTNNTGYSTTNTGTLNVEFNYGDKPIGTISRVVYEVPVLLQEMSGRIRIVFVRLMAWRS